MVVWARHLAVNDLGGEDACDDVVILMIGSGSERR
jgi:hypothetical protein